MQQNKYIVVHAGKRDDYQVALALHEANMLYCLVTEAYFPLDKKWFVFLTDFLGIRSKFYRRYKEGLPSSKVCIPWKAHFYEMLFLWTKNVSFDSKKGYALGKYARKFSQRYNILSSEVKLATDFLCASSLTKKSLMFKGVSEDKIKVIPYGVDTAKFTFSERKHSEIFKVIFIGSLNQRKGITYLLDALAQLQNIELTIVTRGIYDETLIQNYNFPIHVVVDVPHEKLQDELHKAHCFVLPSILEGFGQVILEAMATGIPVIATENTAAIDIIESGKEGFVTPIRNVQAIKENIEKLQNDFSLVQVMGKAAHEKAKIYSWQKFRTDLVTHIQSLSK